MTIKRVLRVSVINTGGKLMMVLSFGNIKNCMIIFQHKWIILSYCFLPEKAAFFFVFLCRHKVFFDIKSVT